MILGFLKIIFVQRKEPMGPFKYLVVIYVLEKDNQGTKFTYIEEFDVCDNYQNEVEKIYSYICRRIHFLNKAILRHSFKYLFCCTF